MSMVNETFLRNDAEDLQVNLKKLPIKLEKNDICNSMIRSPSPSKLSPCSKSNLKSNKKKKNMDLSKKKNINEVQSTTEKKNYILSGENDSSNSSYTSPTITSTNNYQVENLTPENLSVRKTIKVPTEYNVQSCFLNPAYTNQDCVSTNFVVCTFLFL